VIDGDRVLAQTATERDSQQLHGVVAAKLLPDVGLVVGHGLAADTKQRGDCCQPVTGCQQAQNLKLAVGERVEILSLGAELAIPQRARQFDGDEAVSRGDCLHGSYHQGRVRWPWSGIP
jgi:hypothetical protein